MQYMSFLVVLMIALVGSVGTFLPNLSLFADNKEKLAIVRAERALVNRLTTAISQPSFVRASMDHPGNAGKFCPLVKPSEYLIDLIPHNTSWSFPSLRPPCEHPTFEAFLLYDNSTPQNLLAGTSDRPAYYTLNGTRCASADSRGCPLEAIAEYRQICEPGYCTVGNSIELRITLRQRKGNLLERFGVGFRLPDITTSEDRYPRMTSMQLYSHRSFGLLCSESSRIHAVAMDKDNPLFDLSKPDQFIVGSGPRESARPVGLVKWDSDWGIECIAPYHMLGCSSMSSVTKVDEGSEVDTVLRGETCMTRSPSTHMNVNRKVYALCCKVERIYR